MQSNVQSQLCILVFPVQSMESELSWDQLDCIWLKESRRQIYVVCQRISPRICSRIAKHDSACGGELGRVIFDLLLRVASGEKTSSERLGHKEFVPWRDRKSTRLNSSHLGISYAVF